MQSPLRSIAVFVMVASTLSSCSAIPGLFATPTPTPSPTPTLTPTPVPTATPIPTPTPPPGGIGAEKQPDGTTLVIDYKLRYQFVLGGGWRTFVPAADGWAPTLGSLPVGSAEYKWLKDQIEQSDPQYMRFLAVEMGTPPRYADAGQFPALAVNGVSGSDATCASIDYEVADLQQAISERAVRTTTGFFRNSHGIEIGWLAVPEFEGSSGTISGPGKMIFFCEAGSLVSISAIGPAELAAGAINALDALGETIIVQPLPAAPADGLNFVPTSDGGSLVVDRKFGYQFELDGSWHPIAITAENAAPLIFKILEFDWGFDPKFHRLAVLSHQPECVAFHASKHYAAQLIVMKVEDVKADVSMQDYIDEHKAEWSRVTRTEVGRNARGVEIGTIEAAESVSGHTYFNLPVRAVAVFFRAGDVMMMSALRAPESLAAGLRPGFATIVDSIELVSAIEVQATPTATP